MDDDIDLEEEESDPKDMEHDYFLMAAWWSLQ